MQDFNLVSCYNKTIRLIVELKKANPEQIPAVFLSQHKKPSRILNTVFQP